jgi:hypothetical protein
MITFIHQGQEVSETEYRAATETRYVIKYNRTTTHIDGIGARSTGGGNDQGSHVSYYAQNACGVLTRGRLATGASFTDLADALADARKSGRKVCKHCEAAATAE